MYRVNTKRIKFEQRVANAYKTSFHSSFHYTACFPSQLPGTFINMYTKQGDVVLDPFSGRGTTILQALNMDRYGIASDLSPVAYTLSHARARTPSKDAIDSALDELSELIYTVSINPYEYRPLLYLYSFDTLRDILAIRELLIEDEIFEHDVNMFLRAYMISILCGKGKDTLLDVGPLMNFRCSVGIYLGHLVNHKLPPVRKDVLSVLSSKIENAMVSGVPDKHGELYLEDITKLSNVIDKEVDLIVSSPPYADVVHFGDFNWLSFWFLKEDHKEFDQETKQNSCSSDYDEYFGFVEEFLKEMYKIISEDTMTAWVVGGTQKDEKRGRLYIPRRYCEVGRDVGYNVYGCFIEEYEGETSKSKGQLETPNLDGIVMLAKGEPKQYMSFKEAYAYGVERNKSIQGLSDEILSSGEGVWEV